MFLGRHIVSLLALGLGARAYIPAQPSNATSGQGVDGIPINQTDTSTLILTWNPMGSIQETVSYQIAGTNSDGLSQGALVHFSENNLTNDWSTTPWIAFVACDANATNASNVDDIFTLAQARGAVSALLYSKWSNACVINPEYADPDNFQQLFDIFSTKKLGDAQLIESQFTNVALPYMSYNATLLNSSSTVIEAAINGSQTGPGYLVATLRAANATASPNSTANGSGSGDIPGAKTGGGSTGLAMIILYAITGCVSALFCVVILSGAIRAIRNPERYGPRPDDPTMGGGLSRTAGLGRAILDTFPIIKFGSNSSDLPQTRPKNVDMATDNGPAIPLTERRNSSSSTRPVEGDATATEIPVEVDAAVVEHPERRASTSRSVEVDHVASHDHEHQHPTAEREVVNPDSIGHETCPICIVDFEEGDDLRVLPCEGKHRFHQACVDPWLLNMSSSCPLCREDFQTLEAMVQDDSPESVAEHSPPGLVATPQPDSPRSRSTLRHPRFSKYLRFAQRRRNQASREEDQNNNESRSSHTESS